MAIPRKPTDEELRKRELEHQERDKIYNEEIRAREKLASKTGMTSREAGREIKLSGVGGAQNRAAQAAEIIRQQQAEKTILESGILNEKEPERVQLDTPEKSGLEKLPVVGDSVGVAKQFGIELSQTDIANNPLSARSFFGKEKAEGEVPLINMAENSREYALQQIQQDVINQGTTLREKTGSIVEGIPLVGALINKYANGLIETPKGKVDTLTQNIKLYETFASDIQSKAKTGEVDPYTAIALLNDAEEDIARMEQRIKILSLESPQLKADGVAINLIETEILVTRKKVFDAKQSAAYGAIAPASDTSVYLSLQNLKGGIK